MYNKEHLEQIINYLWADEMTHFEEVYNIDYNLANHNWDNRKEVAEFLNRCIKEGRTKHIFYTLVQLHYETL